MAASTQPGRASANRWCGRATDGRRDRDRVAQAASATLCPTICSSAAQRGLAEFHMLRQDALEVRLANAHNRAAAMGVDIVGVAVAIQNGDVTQPRARLQIAQCAVLARRVAGAHPQGPFGSFWSNAPARGRGSIRPICTSGSGLGLDRVKRHGVGGRRRHPDPAVLGAPTAHAPGGPANTPAAGLRVGAVPGHGQ